MPASLAPASSYACFGACFASFPSATSALLSSSFFTFCRLIGKINCVRQYYVSVSDVGSSCHSCVLLVRAHRHVLHPAPRCSARFHTAQPLRSHSWNQHDHHDHHDHDEYSACCVAPIRLVRRRDAAQFRAFVPVLHRSRSWSRNTGCRTTAGRRARDASNDAADRGIAAARHLGRPA